MKVALITSGAVLAVLAGLLGLLLLLYPSSYNTGFGSAQCQTAPIFMQMVDTPELEVDDEGLLSTGRSNSYEIAVVEECKRKSQWRFGFAFVFGGGGVAAGGGLLIAGLVYRPKPLPHPYYA